MVTVIRNLNLYINFVSLALYLNQVRIFKKFTIHRTKQILRNNKKTQDVTLNRQAVNFDPTPFKIRPPCYTAKISWLVGDRTIGGSTLVIKCASARGVARKRGDLTG